MKELKRILSDNYKRYPAMEAGDFIKLIYQNEFAGGHFIEDEKLSLERLQKEYFEADFDPSVKNFEYIGNGIYRLNLRSLSNASPADLEKINSDFVKTANEHKGSLDSFLKKIELLRTLIREGTIPLGLEDFENYISEYAELGYPPISHSDTYKRLYKPSYRVLKKLRG